MCSRLAFPELPILYEDDDTVVINKPAGVVVNRSRTHGQYTIQDWMQRQYGNIRMPEYVPGELSEEQIIWGDPKQVFGRRAGVVHRLDQDTSGVLLLAKHPMALIFYMSQFKQRQTKKTYEVLVHGKLQPENGTINLPIGRNTQKRLQFAVREDGRESTTEYHVKQFYPTMNLDNLIELVQQNKQSRERFAVVSGLSKNISRAIKIYQGFSLVEAHPLTGRTHQLRVHFAHLKHSIVGDKIYSGSKKIVVDSLWCPRQFLHARSLQFELFSTHKTMTVEAPFPTDLQQALDCLNSQ